MRRKSQDFAKEKGEPIEMTAKLNGGTRVEIKQSFAKLWLAEAPYKKYVYKVESCEDGSSVFLHRPTYKHGLDFAVSVEGFKSTLRKTKSTRPSHSDIIEDFKKKIKTHPELKNSLFKAIGAVYDCVEPDQVLFTFPLIKRFSCGLPIDKVLRITKWLFIEQDVTYWLGTGRNMLMSAIEQDVFEISDSDLFR